MVLQNYIDVDGNDVSISIALEKHGKTIKNGHCTGQLFSADDLSVRLAEPCRLQSKPDTKTLVFGKQFTDHMLKISWRKNRGGWQQPEITPLENLAIHPAANVFHYAVELFEGMKAYRGVDGRIRMFRPDMNMKRMNLSAKRSGLPSFDGDELIKCIKRLISIDQDWVPQTETASLYIRPTLIGTDPVLGINSSAEIGSALLYIILSPVNGYFGKSDTTRGVSLLADPSYVRAWPGGVGDCKMGSNYGPTIHVQNEASKQGLQQVLWLYGPDHQLTEVGTMNVFLLVIDDQGERNLITPPLDGLILPGITRDSILHLARQWNECRVTESTITMAEVCDLLKKNRILEMFGSGTACIVCPIERIKYLGKELLIPTMKQENAMFVRFRDTLSAIQYGKIDHPWAVTIN